MDVETPVEVVPAEPELLKVDACAFSLKEYSRGGSGMLLKGLWFKLFRMHDMAMCGQPAVADLAPFRTENPDVIAAGMARIGPDVTLFQAAGFLEPVWYRIEDSFNSVNFYAAILAHPSGDCFAQVVHREWRHTAPPHVAVLSSVVSMLEDGGFIGTTSGSNILDLPPNCRMSYTERRVPSQQLLDRHRARVKNLAKTPLKPLPDSASAAAAAEAFHAGIARGFLRRGIFKPLSSDEQEILRQSKIDGEFAHHSDVLVEINRQNNKRSGPLAAVIMLVVSLLLFLNFQKGSQSWQTLGLLVGVLFFHEAGHFVAMKLFGYKDVRMFFIPFFGAAVTGRNLGAAGWKQALVSLAGPLPGIALGTVLGIASLITSNKDMSKAASLLLLLNAFNLAPMLPFDGGRVLQAVLFCRSPMMDVIFQGLAVIACLALSAFAGDRVIMSVGIAFAIALPVTWRVARIAAELRKNGGVQSGAEHTMPPQAAGMIVDKLRTAFPKNQNRRSIATLSRQVYDRVCSVPPTGLATAGLLTLYVGGGLLGAIFGAVMVVAAQGNLRSITRMAQTQPAHTLDVSQIQEWDGASSCARQTHLTCVATFPNAAAALRSFNEAKSQLPASAAARLLGDSLLVMLPFGDETSRKSWFEKLDAQAPGAFVLQLQQQSTARAQFIVVDAKAGEDLSNELRAYFSVAYFHAIAPWEPNDTRDPATRAANAAARRTYAELLSWNEIPSGGEDKDLHKRFEAALREGDKPEMDRISKEISDRIEARRQKKISDTRKKPYAVQAVIDAYVENTQRPDRPGEMDLNLFKERQKSFAEKMAALIGASSPGNAKTGPPWSVRCSYGGMHQEGMLYQVPYCAFEDIANGAPAFFRWLHDRGASNIRYEIVGKVNADDEDER